MWDLHGLPDIIGILLPCLKGAQKWKENWIQNQDDKGCQREGLETCISCSLLLGFIIWQQDHVCEDVWRCIGGTIVSTIALFLQPWRSLEWPKTGEGTQFSAFWLELGKLLFILDLGYQDFWIAGKTKACSLHKSSQTSHFICTSCAHCHIALIRFLALTLVGCDRVKHRTYQRLETKTKRLKNDWNTIKKTSQSISKLSPRFFGPPEHREAARSLCKASILWRKLRSPRGYQHLPDAHDQRPLEATFPGSVKENGTIIVIISGFKCLIYLNWDKIADVAISSLSQRLLATNIRICNRLTGCAMRLVSEGMSWVYGGCGQLSFNQRLRIEPKRQVSSKQFSGGQYLFDTKGRHQNGHKFCEKKIRSL